MAEKSTEKQVPAYVALAPRYGTGRSTPLLSREDRIKVRFKNRKSGRGKSR